VSSFHNILIFPEREADRSSI